MTPNGKSNGYGDTEEKLFPAAEELFLVQLSQQIVWIFIIASCSGYFCAAILFAELMT